MFSPPVLASPSGAFSPFKFGDILTFSYPVNNRRTIQTSFSTRRAVITKVRDLVHDPLPAHWFRRRPDLRRSRFLYRCQDLDRQTWRQFYLGSMKSIRQSAMPLMRLGIYDPTSTARPHLFGPLFTDCQADQAAARELLRRYNRWLYERDRGQVVRLFPQYGTPNATNMAGMAGQFRQIGGAA